MRVNGSTANLSGLNSKWTDGWSRLFLLYCNSGGFGNVI